MKKKFNTIKIHTSERNPKWRGGSDEPFYIQSEVDAEILSLHFNTNKMRIRYKTLTGQTVVTYFGLESFFASYSIERTW